ncbi:MAG: hypothetical protein ACQ9MH_12060 [Nitrospinales bacterium]
MKEQNFQEAIEKLISDGNYSNSIVANPDKLAKDFGLNGTQILALKPSDTPGITNGGIRATSICCCCTCTLAQYPEEKEEVVS